MAGDERLATAGVGNRGGCFGREGETLLAEEHMS